jgi:hypothetical protein
VQSVVRDPRQADTLYIGADDGFFFTTNNGLRWLQYQAGLPNAGIDQLFTDQSFATFIVATHGRGMFTLPTAALAGQSTGPTATPSATATPGATGTSTATASATATGTPTSSPTATGTATPSATGTSTSTPTASPTVTSTETADRSFSMQVTAGWNLIGLPTPSSATLSASALLQAVLQSGGGKLAALYELHDNQWSSPVVLRDGAPSGTDFTLQPGQAYLIYSDTGGTYTGTALQSTGAPIWTLNTGWNLVSSGPGSPSASTVLGGILTAGTGGHLAAIYALANSQWSQPLVDQNGTLSGTGFLLQPGQGYLLYVDHDVTYAPGAAAPRSEDGRSLPPMSQPGSERHHPARPTPVAPPVLPPLP